jgi:hypothetical protein
MRTLLSGFIATLLIISSHWITSFAYAEEYKTEDGYNIHYNAVNTQFIPKEVAQGYGILRSKNQAFLSVVVMQVQENAQPKHVTAQITAQVVNLNRQLRQIDMREIRENTAIYYIGVFKINDADTLNFTLKIIPEGQTQAKEITFQKEFFID